MLWGDMAGMHLEHQQRGEGQGELPETLLGDLHRLQMHREICSKTVICGTGDLPERLKKNNKIIPSTSGTGIYKGSTRRSIFTAFT